MSAVPKTVLFETIRIDDYEALFRGQWFEASRSGNAFPIASGAMQDENER